MLKCIFSHVSHAMIEALRHLVRLQHLLCAYMHPSSILYLLNPLHWLCGGDSRRMIPNQQ